MTETMTSGRKVTDDVHFMSTIVRQVLGNVCKTECQQYAAIRTAVTGEITFRVDIVQDVASIKSLLICVEMFLCTFIVLRFFGV